MAKCSLLSRVGKSRTSCARGDWGCDGHTLWTTAGCMGVFACATDEHGAIGAMQLVCGRKYVVVQHIVRADCPISVFLVVAGEQ